MGKIQPRIRQGFTQSRRVAKSTRQDKQEAEALRRSTPCPCPPPAPPNVGAYCNSTTWDAASPVYVNNKWHRAEFYVAMNSTSGGIANKDGVFKHWIDGNLVVDYNNVQLRTGDNPNRKFNQFALLPFIGDGSPIAQDLWIDNLIVADQRIASGPPAPTNLRMLP